MAEPHCSQPTLDRIKAIMRRDLKLNPAAEIPDDMALFGGHMDLDSLDVLLLLTSIEKEFACKINTEATGVGIFRTLRTLTEYLEAHQRPGVTATTLNTTDLQTCLAKLPHQPPFRFVSRVLDIKAGHSGQGEWQIQGDEALFQGHFPGRPIVPGVLISEALAQMSGLVAGNGNGHPNHSTMLAHVDVRFRQPVLPPATILLASTLEKIMGGLYHFDVRASVAATVVAEGALTLASTAAPAATSGA